MKGQILSFLLLTGLAAYYLYTMQPQNDTEFAQWKQTHAKVYASEAEEKFRQGIFALNLAKIRAHNADPTQTYTMAMNHFGDLTGEEFAAQYLTLKVGKTENKRTLKDAEVKGGSVNWVTAGKVTGVKDQGQCGSCWAFSAVGAHESALMLAGQNALLSEQQLVDCSGSYGNMGCNGGWMDQAFAYARDKGLTTGAAYPYVARDQSCQTNSGSYRLSSWVDVAGCDNLWNALNSRPVSVAVDASNWSFYSSGIFSNCGTGVNHGVLLVAGDDSSWTIKNSWSSRWGESGFIRLARGNTCAVCSYPSYPVL